MLSLIGDAFIKVNGLLGGGLGVIAGILATVLIPGHAIPLGVVVLVGFLVSWAMWVLLEALRAATLNAKAIHSERGGVNVEACVAPFSPYENSKCIFIVRF